MSNTPQTAFVPVELLRGALKSQYHAGLDMLRAAIEACPAELWSDTAHRNPFWSVAYHVLFYTHFYLHRHADEFRPWEKHRDESHRMGGGAPYTKEEVLAYLELCDGFVDPAVDALDPVSPESGFDWYPMSKLEHQLVNVRHLGHHAGQLIDRVRVARDEGVAWVGARSSRRIET